MKKLFSVIIAVILLSSQSSFVFAAESTEQLVTMTFYHSSQGMTGDGKSKVSTTDDFGRNITRYYADENHTSATKRLSPGGYLTDSSGTGKEQYTVLKLVYNSTHTSAPSLVHYTNASSSYTVQPELVHTHMAGQWNIAYYKIENMLMFQLVNDLAQNGGYLDVAYIAAFATMDEATAHKSEFEGDVVITSAKAGANELTIENGVANYNLAGASAVPELVITATGDTNGVTVENGKLTAASDGKATSYVKKGNETILTVNFTGGEYAPITPAELTATAATSDTDYDGIEDYRVQSGSKTDDFGRAINTYKPLWYYFTGDENGTQDIYVTGNLRANVEVPSTVTKDNYKTVKLVYRTTSTEVPTLASGAKTYEAANNASAVANTWTALYFDYSELSAADSFIINLTEGTNPEEYKDETWEIGYLGLMEDAAAAHAHTSAFEGEFAITDVLLDGTSIGNVTSFTQALNGAGEVPALTVKATGDTSKVTITNGTIDGEGKATSKVTNDGEDVVVVSFTGGDATFRVTDILVDGNSIGSLDAATVSYTFDLGFGAQQPVVTYTYAGAAKELTITTVPATDQNDLVAKYTVTIADGTTVLYTLVFNVDTSLDSRLVNSLYRLQVDKELNVSYFGGSVTNGFYSGFVTEWFKENYGTNSTVGATINAVQSSIGGSGSMFAVHRLKEHVVEYMATQVPANAKSKLPDLIFIECAINDVSGYDPVYKADGTKLAIADSNQQYINAESMVRQLYAVNPKIDIIFVITGDYARLRDDFTSDTPVFGKAYTELAKHYDIPIMYVGRELVRDNFETYPASAKEDAWTKFIKSDGVHPTEAGGKDYADTITAYLAEDLPKTFTPAAKDYADKTMPETVYCTVNNKGDLIVDAGLVDIEKVDRTKLGGWTVGTAVNYGLNYPLLSSNAGDVFSFETNATNVWLWMHAKSTETELVWTVDGGEPKSWKFKMGNPNNYALQLAEGLDNTKTHTIRLYHSDANPVDIRSIMLSGMPEGSSATITPVPYFDMDTETYTVKVGGEVFEDFDPDVKEYELPIDSLEEGAGYPEITFECRDDYYGYTISQADLESSDNSAELSIDNVAAYTFSFTIGDAVEVDTIVKESAYKAGDAKIVLAKAAEYPVQLKEASAKWADAQTYPAGTTEFTGLAAGEYVYRYVVAEGSYGTAGIARIWNKYPTGNVYYVSDNGAGDGSTPEKAAKSDTIVEIVKDAKEYFTTKLGAANLANATCYIALVGDVTHSQHSTGLEVFCKELVITGEYGSSFNMKKRITHKLVSESTGKLVWRDVAVVLGDPASSNSEIYYGLMGNEVEFDNFYLKGYAAGCSSGIEMLVFAPMTSSDVPVTGKVMTFDSENNAFNAIRYSNFNRAVYSGYINFEYNNGKVSTLALGGRGGRMNGEVHASDFNTVSKLNVNGGEITDLYVSGSNKYGTSRGTLAAIINGGTVTNVKVVESGLFEKGKTYDNNGNFSETGANIYSGKSTSATAENTDRVVIFNNGTSAKSIQKDGSIDYILHGAQGGSADITTSTDAANLYRLTGFKFTTSKSAVIIKQGNETVKTLIVTDGTASVSVSELPAGEYTITYGNPVGIASISAKIKLGRAADKTAAAGNGLKLEIRNTATNELLRTIELETADAKTDADGYITVNLQANVGDITAENITLVALKNGYAPYSISTTNAELVSTIEAMFASNDTEFVKGHGDIKESLDDDCGDGKVDIDDFIRVIRGFNYSDTDEYKQYAAIVDLDEDGTITVNDLGIIKNHFGYGTTN